MLGFAVGEMGMRPCDVDGLTIREFVYVSKAYHDKQQSDIKMRWEQARWIAFYAVKPYSKKLNKPQELLAFPWDSGKQKKPHTAAEQVDTKSDLEEYKRLIGYKP